MPPCFQNEIHINELYSHNGVTIWYANIPDIINAFFATATYHKSLVGVNEIFKKQDFRFPCFSSIEIETVNGFKALKKQVEWMAGRYLIKQMIQTLFLPDHSLEAIRLGYREHGAPFVKNHSQISFSLSHSHAYTTAACSENPGQSLGIDIEKISGKPGQAFLRTAFTQNEISDMEDTKVDIFKRWTIKEAYLKFIKKGFHESLHQVEVIGNRIFHRGNPVPIDIFSQQIQNDYIISLVSEALPPHEIK